MNNVLIDRDNIILNYASNCSNKNELINELIPVILNEMSVDQQEKIIAELIAREELSTTGFGKQIAIPHAQTTEIDQAQIYIIKLNNSIDWNAIDDLSIKLIFLLLVPKDCKENTHIMLLSRLARLLMKDDFVTMLNTIQTESEMATYINKMTGD